MHAIPPRPVPTNTAFHTTLKTTLEPHLPPTLVDMINDYADIDYTEALGNFEYNKFGYISQSPHNKAIFKAMKLALTSAECDPKIKRYLFCDGRDCRHVLVDVLSEIHKEGLRVNLDNTDLSGCNFSELDLSNMSAQGASFVHCYLCRSILKGADLTGAVFFYCNARQADFRNATLTNTTWTKTSMFRTMLIKADMTKARLNKMYFVGTWVSGLITDDALLNEVLRDAADATSPYMTWIEGSSISGLYSTGAGLAHQDRFARYLNHIERGFEF